MYNKIKNKNIREPMGISPEVLSKRKTYAVKYWCPDKKDFEFDKFCDAENPKNIHIHHISKAMRMLKVDIPKTPMMKTRNHQIEMNLYFKLENCNPTKSFHDRGALYVLMRLSEEQRARGVITASLGNFAIALSYYGQKLGVHVSIVLPEDVCEQVANRCRGYGATVVVRGRDLAESKLFACKAYRNGMIYINGWDHPHVIAGAGVIALEALQALREADAIIVPVGGGGLLAGVATAAKHINKNILVYGVEPKQCCSFFKAMQNDFPYKTVVENSIATELRVNTAGYNAFNTVKALVDKLILVSDDDIMRAVLHLAEYEKLVVSGAGATALASLLAVPNLVPELKNKTVICVITSSNNVPVLKYSTYLQRGLFVDGRIVQFHVTMDMTNSVLNRKLRAKIISVVANVGCKVIDMHLDNEENPMLNREDFDEFCDPANPVTLTIEMVLKALDQIRSEINYTPCTPSHHQHGLTMYLYYKLDLLQHTGSFKERGILNALLTLPTDKKKIGASLASNGNAALAFCYHAKKLNIPAVIVLTNNASFNLVQKCQSLGAKVYIQGSNLTESMRFARALARDKKLTYINSLDHPQVLAGHGTLALEIIDQLPFVDAVILPVGSGGLAAAVATVIKHIKPGCLVYGVQPESSAVFFRTLQQANDVLDKKVVETMARSINVPSVGVNAFHTAKDLLDKMLLVKDDWIARAMLHLYEEERYYVEGAAACPLAAILGNLVPELKLKKVVCVLTGGNENPLVFYRCIEKGLAYEGRLLRFKVSIPEGTRPLQRLNRLLTDAGYRVLDMKPVTTWIYEEDYGMMTINLLVETKSLEHAFDLKSIIDKAYPSLNAFATEPFNDSRTCPCFVRRRSRNHKKL